MMEKLIYERLSSLNPIKLSIIDESHKHHGHQPDLPSHGTHFKIEIIADCFKGKNKVTRHRMIYEALNEAFKGHLHALSIKASAPEEERLSL
jgi:BolA protein